MNNILLTKYNPETELVSKSLGFEKTLFLEKDFILLTGTNKKELLRSIDQARSKKLLTIYKADDEEMLRFIIEKTNINIIFGMEEIFAKDSLHFVRGGLDQILCTLAKQKNKTIGFSYAQLLHCGDKPKLLRRMMFNLSMCEKYKVKTLVSNFSADVFEMRSAKDLAALERVMRKKGK